MEAEYNGITYEGMIYSTKEVNSNFKIKIVGTNGTRKVERIVGVSGLMEEVEDSEVVNNILRRAFESGLDKTICKLRRGLRVIFFRH